MKHNYKIRKLAALLAVITLSLLPAACSGQQGAPAAAATTSPQAAESQASESQAPESQAAETAGTEAAGSGDAAESDPEETAQAVNAALSPIPFEYTDYIREYPGTEGSDLKFTASARLLRITAAGYEALQESLDELNAGWKQEADYAFASQAQEFASEELNEFLMSMLPYSAEQWCNMSRADSRVLSFSKSTCSWYGGAHPYSYQLGFSFDSADGRMLKLEDAVTDYNAFYREVLTALEKYPDSDYFFDEWKDTLKEEFYTEPEPQVNWMIDRDGLSVWFNQYDIAPYAMGPVELHFAAKEYKDLIKQEYFPDGIPEVEDSYSPYDKPITVSDLCREAGEYEDGVGNTFWYSYRLPEISGSDTEYIREANEEIEELKKGIVDEQMEAMKDGTSLYVFDVGYSAVTWNGITSVMVHSLEEGDMETYRCFNFREDGTKADNEEILEKFGLTTADFVKEARRALSEYVVEDTSGLDKEIADALREMGEQTLSEENCNDSLPLYITADRGLGFIAGYYTPAGAGYYKTAVSVPGTEHRQDGLTKININPQSTDNITLKDGSYEIRDSGAEKPVFFDASTVLIEGLPCYDDGCDPMTWMKRYLEHPAFVDTADDPYNYSGFAPGDIMTLLIDENRHVSVLQSIGYWD